MEDDDFGYLYGDLDYQVNAAAGGACGAARSNSERGGRDSVVGEGVSIGDGDERSWGDGNANRVGDLVLEAEDVDYDSGSESEDDLRIVLNEDHSKKLMISQRACVGNGAWSVVGGGQEDNGDGDPAVVAGFNHLNVELSPAEGMIQRVKGIGNLPKTCYNSRFIGSQLAGYADISAVSSSRADLDHLVIPSSGGSVSSSRMSTTVLSGLNFSLPRTRTIFDISIEAFEQKPWRQHGVDITDYFNYGLNEESWICYWQSVDVLRQEAGLSSRCLSFESSKLQLLSKDIPREALQSASGKSLLRETVEKGPKGIDAGRAIQVESSVGERLPSVDLRRSRQRDSDVVIQIKIDDSMDGRYIPYEEQSDMREVDDPPQKCEKKLIDGSILDEDKSRNPSAQCHQEGSNDSRQATSNEMQTKLHSKKGDGEAPSGSSSFLDEAACPFAIDISNPSCSRFDNSSDTSERSDALHKLHDSIKKASSSSLTGFQDSVKFNCDVSDDSGCNYTRTDEENDKINDNKKPSSDNHNDGKRSESKRMPEDDVASTQSCKKWQNFANSNGVSHHIREVKHGNSDVYHRDLACNRERKKTGSCKSRRHTDERSSTKVCYIKRIEDAYSGRKMVENDFLYEDVQDHYMTREHFHSSERYLDPIVRMCDQSQSDDSSSRLGYFFTEKDILYFERKRIKSHLIQDGHRHKEQRQPVIQRRHPSYFDRININSEVVRNRTLSAREVTCSKSRDKYYQKLSPDRNQHNIYDKSDAKGSRQPDWMFDYEMHVPRTGYEKGQYNSSRDNIATAMKLCDDLTNNDRHCDMRKINNGYGYCHENKKHLTSNKASIEFEYHKQQYVEERYQYLNENYDRMRERWMLRPRASADDYGSLGHGELVDLSSRDGCYLRERISRKKGSYVAQDIDDGSRHSDGDTFACDKNDMFSITSINYCSRDDNRFPFENSSKRRLDLETIGRNEAVIMHLNGVKRKFHKRDHEVPGRNGRRLKKVKDEQNVQDSLDDPSYHSRLDGAHAHPISMEKTVSKFKVEPSHDRFLNMHQDNGPAAEDSEDEIEEGQLIEEPCPRDVSMTKHRSSKDEAANHAVKRASRFSCLQEKMTLEKQNTASGKEYDEKRILEMLAKMEKRRERFKEPLPPKQRVDKMPEVSINVAGVTYEAKLQRPVRKRQWGCG